MGEECAHTLFCSQCSGICNVEDGHVTHFLSVGMVGSGPEAQPPVCTHLCERIMGLRRALAC